MNHGHKFTSAVGCMPLRDKWTSIKEKELKALKAKAELLDEVIEDVKRIESAQHRGDWMALDAITNEILAKVKACKEVAK